MAFFLPRGALTPEAALAAVGAGSGSFGPITRVHPTVDLLDFHACVQLYFRQAQLLRLRARRDPEGPPPPVAEDGAVALAQAFRDACARSSADAGFVVTHDYEAERAFILEREWMVLAGEANSLAAERFGLLYLSDALARELSPAWHRQGRDELPGGPGVTLFAGSGWSRWA